jgi:hypothetical protein
MIYTIGRPTRQPGKYSVVWDGKDDKGQPAPTGDYVVMIESAREHGTHQFIRKPIRIADSPFAENLEGGAEIKSARVEFKHRAQTP